MHMMLNMIKIPLKEYMMLMMLVLDNHEIPLFLLVNLCCKINNDKNQMIYDLNLFFFGFKKSLFLPQIMIHARMNI